MPDPDQWGYTVFCDDIREEANGKLTLIGIYENVMFVHGDFPFLLPKFGMAVRYFERRGVFTDEEVTLRAFLPGQKEPFVEGPIGAPEGRKNVKDNPFRDPSKPPGFMRVAANIILSPVIVPAAGMIRVRAECRGETVRLGSLMVMKPTVETAPSTDTEQQS